MNFTHPKLVAKYGSWVRVQVEFYDFLFSTASGLCPKEFNEGDGAYQKTVRAIEREFAGPNQAWTHFLEKEGLSDD